jgi:hypothetical protein
VERQGCPQGRTSDDIALAGRVAHVAGVGAKFDVLGGPQLAVDAVRRRAGSVPDPSIAETFAKNGRALLEAAGRGSMMITA